ncbi:class I adenylate-forming enzyme family protein [Pandoraea sputorum]|uniref:class I adenylate-forming enzyme family protein n=1 Tax=Pandoraea sputorum TaxID=93222 RepID=UPI00123F13F2|nr:class I adenylate-forming enzyme family protein [Pandoraea sputorum]VVE55060.1 AMP-binding protein [Pandoraea sputorum]
MARLPTLSAPVAPVDSRRAQIEGEALPPNLHTLLEDAAQACGDRVLCNFFERGERVTYRDFLAQVERIASGLQANGVRKGTHVAVIMPNLPAMPLTWFALATLGAVMVPVNIHYTPRELTYVLSDSDAEFIVAHESVLARIELCLQDGSVLIDRTKIFVKDGRSARYRDWDELACAPAQTLATGDVAHADLLNIQYTSGTTGLPKGCLLTQEYWLVSGKANAFRDGRSYSNLLAPTPFYYMDPQWLLLMTLYQRGTLFVANKQSASRFMSWVRQYDINFCLLPYLVYKQDAHPDDGVNKLVRANVYGVPRELHEKIETRFDLVAREAFGMTEVGPAMFMPIEATEMVGSGSCGVPSPFRECKVLDDDGNLVKPGEVGELCVRGRGIMLGYYGNDAATQAAFAGDWFRTGDAFWQDEKGYFYIQGRYKDMIRRSAENIAAREVEAVLNGIGEVSESAVLPVPDPIRGEEVKAFIVLASGVEPTLETIGNIVAGCAQNLAPFKVPRYYAFVDALPKTASLKIAKAALRARASKDTGMTYDRVEGRWISPDAGEVNA